MYGSFGLMHVRTGLCCRITFPLLIPSYPLHSFSVFKERHGWYIYSQRWAVCVIDCGRPVWAKMQGSNFCGSPALTRCHHGLLLIAMLFCD